VQRPFTTFEQTSCLLLCFPDGDPEEFPRSRFLDKSHNPKIVRSEARFDLQSHVFNKVLALLELSYLCDLLYDSHVLQMPATIFPMQNL